MGKRTFRYDEADEIVFVAFPEAVTLATEEQVDVFFRESDAFWRENVRKRAYYVVDIGGLHINARLVDAYARNVKALLSTQIITVVRYGGAHLQRTTTRLAAMKMHVPSHIYASRAEAIEVVHALRAGAMSVAPAT